MEIYYLNINTTIKTNKKMCKKIIYIAILLLNSVIVFSQEKNDTKTKSSDKNTPVTDTGGGGYQYLVYLPLSSYCFNPL